jgi:hypothetical protein
MERTDCREPMDGPQHDSMIIRRSCSSKSGGLEQFCKGSWEHCS